MPKILILALLTLFLSACGPATQQTRPVSSNSSALPPEAKGKIVVTPSNLHRLIPDKRKRKRFILVSIGPYGFIYRECVYFKASKYDKDGRDIYALVDRAEESCNRYLILVRKWLKTVNHKLHNYYLSPEYQYRLIEIVRVTSARVARKLLHKKRRGIPVRSPRNPDELVEKLKRRLTGERSA